MKRSVVFSCYAALFATLASGQFSVNTQQPLCSTTYTMNCANFAPQDGTIILGWNVDMDRHDTISEMVNRMNAATGPTFSATLPGAYGMFLKIGATGLIGQTPNDPIPEDLDTILEQLKGTNSIFVTSLDPVEGYDSVTQAGIEAFADKLAEFNRFGIPVLVRPAHEMNGPWYTYGLQPTKFKAFYINVYNTVKQKAPFVRFIFAPNLGTGYPWSSIPPKTPLTAEDIAAADTSGNGVIDALDDPYLPYYPGDEYVDWFGASMYWKGDYPYVQNMATPAEFIADQLNQVLGGGVSSYEFARLRNLPIVFPEMGAPYTATNPGVTNLAVKRQFWIDAFGPATRLQFPLLKMGLWFDYSKYEDAAQRDFSISNRNATFPLSSIDEVAPTFKEDIATYPHLMFASHLTLSPDGTCGCLRYSAEGTAVTATNSTPVTPSQAPVVGHSVVPLPSENAVITADAEANNASAAGLRISSTCTFYVMMISLVAMHSIMQSV